MTALLLLLSFLAPSALTVDAATAPGCFADRSFTVGRYTETRLFIRQDGVALAARLLMPATPGPHPAVVVLPGGGAAERVNHTPHVVAARLARCGVAALLFDKRGTGHSGGDWATATYDDFIADATAAFDTLRAQPSVDAQRVGVLGFSQGGRLAPVVATRRPAAFVAVVSAPFVPIVETRQYALHQLFARRGYPQRRQETLNRLWRAFFETLPEGGPTPRLDAQLHRYAFLPAAALPPSSDQYQPSPLYNSIGRDYAGALAHLHVPFFALFGSRDDVIPVDPSIAVLQAQLPPNTPLEVLVIPGVDHSFLYPRGHTPRYRFEEPLVAWVLAQAGRMETCKVTQAYPTIQRLAPPQPLLADSTPHPDTTPQACMTSLLDE